MGGLSLCNLLRQPSEQWLCAIVLCFLSLTLRVALAVPMWNIQVSPKDFKMNSEQITFVRPGGRRLFSLLRLPCGKGGIGINQPRKPVSSTPDPRGLGISSWRRVWWLPISSGAISALVWNGATMFKKQSATQFYSSGQETKKGESCGYLGRY